MCMHTLMHIIQKEYIPGVVPNALEASITTRATMIRVVLIISNGLVLED